MGGQGIWKEILTQTNYSITPYLSFRKIIFIMRFSTLYSGSGGNAAYIESDGAAIIIDAGKSAKRLCMALKEIGSSIQKIDAIFITHDHADHTSALESLTKKHKIPIHITEKSAEIFEGERFSDLRKNIVPHPPVFEVRVGDLTVRSFVTSHDSKMSVGYRIDADNGTSLGLATDLGYVSENVKEALVGCRAVILESNHDIDMLEDGPYPRFLKERILSKRGHLSNEDSSLFSAFLATNGTTDFLLAHLSAENNTPSHALDAFLSAVADSSVHVFVASAEEPTEINF